MEGLMRVRIGDWHAMLSRIYWQAHRIRRKTATYWSTLDKFRSMAGPEARLETFRDLSLTLKHFAKRSDSFEEWRSAATVQDPDNFLEQWQELPIITKKDLQNRFNPERMQSIGVAGLVSSTGGSTGEPTPFVHNREMIETNYAASLYARREFGWTFGMPTIVIWGSERDIGKQRTLRNRISSRMRNELLIDGYSLTDETTDRVLGAIQHYKKVAIWGFSGLLEFVAQNVIDRRLSVKGKVEAVWNGGEMLSEAQSTLFARAFGAPIKNMYGGRELSTMAFQEDRMNHLRIVRPFLFAELVDEQGRPTAPGEVGRLIWTSTVCRGTPFIRYDIGDLAVANAYDRDESGIRTISELHGRSGGLMKLPNGKTIGGLFWNHFFKDFAEVKQFQVALIGDGLIELRLVGNPFSLNRESQLRSTLENFVGPQQIRVKWLTSIPLTAQGKRVQVVRESVNGVSFDS